MCPERRGLIAPTWPTAIASLAALARIVAEDAGLAGSAGIVIDPLTAEGPAEARADGTAAELTKLDAYFEVTSAGGGGGGAAQLLRGGRLPSQRTGAGIRGSPIAALAAITLETALAASEGAAL